MGAGTWLMNAALSNLRQTGKQKTYAKEGTTHIATYEGNVMLNFARIAGIIFCEGTLCGVIGKFLGNPEREASWQHLKATGFCTLPIL